MINLYICKKREIKLFLEIFLIFQKNKLYTIKLKSKLYIIPHLKIIVGLQLVGVKSVTRTVGNIESLNAKYSHMGSI